MILLETLQRVAIWSRELTPAEGERARRGMVEKTYAKGTYICHRGDKFDAWAGVVSGLAKLSAISQSGKQVTLTGLPSGAWFGEGSVLKNEERRYDLVALRETRLVLVDCPTFFWLFENSAGFNRYLVRQFNERLGQFIGQVENDRMLDATGRVARALASLFNPDLHPTLGSHIDITQEEVGLLSGLSRQVANQSLKTLEQAKLLRVERGGITMLSLKGLRSYGE